MAILPRCPKAARLALVLLPAAAFLFWTAGVQGASVGAGYYVARDNQTLVSGNPNPNFGRLTFLFNHGDHFHSLGRFGGPEGRIPEAYVGGAVTMFNIPSGGFETRPYDDEDDPASEYSHFEVRDIHDLAGYPPGSPEAILYESSGGRWSTLDLDGAEVAFEIVSISSGLRLASVDGSQVASSEGERLLLGAGEGFALPFKFFTDPDAFNSGQLGEVVLRLVDVRSSGTPFDRSGEIRFALRAVPEPGSVLLLGCGVTGAVGILAVRTGAWRRSRSKIERA